MQGVTACKLIGGKIELALNSGCEAIMLKSRITALIYLLVGVFFATTILPPRLASPRVSDREHYRTLTLLRGRNRPAPIEPANISTSQLAARASGPGVGRQQRHA